MRKLLLVTAVFLPLIGCARPVAPGGTSTGAGAAEPTATLAGTSDRVVLNELAGSNGTGLDLSDRAAIERTTQQTLETVPTNQSVEWRNPNNGNSGAVIPVQTYRSGKAFCREYQQTIIYSHVPSGTPSERQAYGRACRQPDGLWQLAANN